MLQSTVRPNSLSTGLSVARPDPVAGQPGGLRSRILRRAQGVRLAVQVGPKVRLAVQTVLILLCLIPVGIQAATQWDAVRLATSQAQLPALAASVLALILASLFLPAAMAVFTRGAAKRISYRHSAQAYFASQPMKYLSGNFWILPGRVFLLRGLGYDVSLSSAALLFEMTTQILANALVAVGLISLAGLAAGWYQQAAWAILAGAAVASALLVVAPSLARRLPLRSAAARQMIAQLAEVPLAARLRNLLLAALLYGVMALIAGISFYALTVASAPRFDPALLQTAIAVSSLSWLAGFLTPFSPGGVGVREGVIVLLLSPVLGGPQAVTVALLSRVLALAVELVFFAVVWRPLRRARAVSTV